MGPTDYSQAPERGLQKAVPPPEATAGSTSPSSSTDCANEQPKPAVAGGPVPYAICTPSTEWSTRKPSTPETRAHTVPFSTGIPVDSSYL
eukprot:365028-Chlamydomonas_euryale.AAC.7